MKPPSLSPESRRKRAAWASANATGRLVRKAPANHASAASFTLHVGDFGCGDITVVKAYRVFAVSSTLCYRLLDKPRPDQVAVLQDGSGTITLVHLADTPADPEAWLKAHPHRSARIVSANAAEPRTFTYLQDPDRGWLLVSHADLVCAEMSAADFTPCSYVSADSFALEEDCDMPRFLKRLDERGIAYRLREHHTNGDAYVRCWACNSSPADPAR